MRTITDSVYRNTPTATTQAYSPSVPLSIYRDLAAELQAKHTRMNELAVQNKQLVQENHLLKQEIAKTVQSVLHLQKLVDSQPMASLNQDPHSYPDFIRETSRPTNEARLHFSRGQNPGSPFVPPVNEIPSPMSETFFIEEEEEVHYYPPSEPEAIDVSGWKIVVTILLIVLMGFGAGYLIVRPFFDHHGR